MQMFDDEDGMITPTIAFIAGIAVGLVLGFLMI